MTVKCSLLRMGGKLVTCVQLINYQRNSKPGSILAQKGKQHVTIARATIHHNPRIHGYYYLPHAFRASIAVAT